MNTLSSTFNVSRRTMLRTPANVIFIVNRYSNSKSLKQSRSESKSRKLHIFSLVAICSLVAISPLKSFISAMSIV